MRLGTFRLGLEPWDSGLAESRGISYQSYLGGTVVSRCGDRDRCRAERGRKLFNLSREATLGNKPKPATRLSDNGRNSSPPSMSTALQSQHSKANAQGSPVA